MLVICSYVIHRLPSICTSSSRHALTASPLQDITESPERPNHKFITFFDTRHAAVAMQAMNRAEREDKVPAHMLSALASSVSSGSLHLPPAQSFVDVAGKGAQQQRSTPGLVSSFMCL